MLKSNLRLLVVNAPETATIIGSRIDLDVSNLANHCKSQTMSFQG